MTRRRQGGKGRSALLSPTAERVRSLVNPRRPTHTNSRRRMLAGGIAGQRGGGRTDGCGEQSILSARRPSTRPRACYDCANRPPTAARPAHSHCKATTASTTTRYTRPIVNSPPIHNHRTGRRGAKSSPSRRQHNKKPLASNSPVHRAALFSGEPQQRQTNRSTLRCPTAPPTSLIAVGQSLRDRRKRCTRTLDGRMLHLAVFSFEASRQEAVGGATTDDQLMRRGRFFSTRRGSGGACRPCRRNPHAVRVIAARGGTLPPSRRRAPSANQRAAAWSARHWPVDAGRASVSRFVRPVLCSLPFSPLLCTTAPHTRYACLRFPPKSCSENAGGCFYGRSVGSLDAPARSAICGCLHTPTSLPTSLLTHPIASADAAFCCVLLHSTKIHTHTQTRSLHV
uniref:Uncharacterized protein n=1 Tax=Plectus sambesii TaxID=2011161 RepID=A0A914WSQ5_9BILA